MEKRLREMIVALRDAGHRVGPQRLAVLRILAGSVAHPDARRIHQVARRSFPNISLATIYKTLVALKETGQVLELEFSGLPNRYDGRRPRPHPHVICEACGRIVDPGGADLSSIVAATGRETGFAISGTRVDFFGTCPACLIPAPD